MQLSIALLIFFSVPHFQSMLNPGSLELQSLLQLVKNHDKFDCELLPLPRDETLSELMNYYFPGQCPRAVTINSTRFFKEQIYALHFNKKLLNLTIGNVVMGVSEVQYLIRYIPFWKNLEYLGFEGTSFPSIEFIADALENDKPDEIFLLSKALAKTNIKALNFDHSCPVLAEYSFKELHAQLTSFTIREEQNTLKMDEFFKDEEMEFPKLERFAISGDLNVCYCCERQNCTCNIEIGELTIAAFRRMPSLSHLTLFGCKFPGWVAFPPNITSLAICNSTPDAIYFARSFFELSQLDELTLGEQNQSLYYHYVELATQLKIQKPEIEVTLHFAQFTHWLPWLRPINNSSTRDD